MSRRGGAVAEVVLTCRNLAEREQCHTVTCRINNKLRPLFLPQKKKKSLAFLCCFSSAHSVSSWKCAVKHTVFCASDYFLTLPSLSVSSPCFSNIFHSLFFTNLLSCPPHFPPQASAVFSFGEEPKQPDVRRNLGKWEELSSGL